MCSDNVDKVHIKNEGKENFFLIFLKMGKGRIYEKQDKLTNCLIVIKSE